MNHGALVRHSRNGEHGHVDIMYPDMLIPTNEIDHFEGPASNFMGMGSSLHRLLQGGLDKIISAASARAGA